MTRDRIGLSFPRSRPRYTATASVATVTDPQRRAAALTVAERSHDAADCALLLDLLGLHDVAPRDPGRVVTAVATRPDHPGGAS